MILDGESVTVMVQRKDVNGKSSGDSYSPRGPTGCEYTLYITTEDPATGAILTATVKLTRR